MQPSQFRPSQPNGPKDIKAIIAERNINRPKAPVVPVRVEISPQPPASAQRVPQGPPKSVTELLADVKALVDEKTAARILSLKNYRTLSVWRSNGSHPDLKFRKIGGCVRYLIADLIAFRDRDS